MAKKGLVRVPYYPQLNVLRPLHPDAPLVMSSLLFWMARNSEPTFCELRHNYQMAMHLGLPLASFTACLQCLKQEQLFIAHEFVIPPKEVTANSKERHETRLSLDFMALERLLAHLSSQCADQEAIDNEAKTTLPPPLPACPLTSKLLQHAADDAFDFYDVIDEKFLPVTQKLCGTLRGDDFTRAAELCSQLVVFINEKHEELAFKAIAPGWKLLLIVPIHQSWQEYAQELSIRFLRTGERAVDLNLSDGNFFFPDYDEIKSPQHLIKHFGQKVEPRIVASALLIALSAHFPQQLYLQSELSVKELTPAIKLVHELWPELDLSKAFTPAYFSGRRLNPEQEATEQNALQQVLQVLQALA